MKKTWVLLFIVLIIIISTSCERKPAAENNISYNMRSIEYYNYMKEGGVFELPVAGSSGYAAINIPLYEVINGNLNVIDALDAGQGFTILDEQNDWWYIELKNNNGQIMNGWVMNKFCMINLPDIIPSIVYNNTNTYSSLFRSSGKDIPGITGTALYQARDFNARLGKEEYIMPVLYGMAKKICAAQQSALEDGNTLIIYETFRPHDAHELLHENFTFLVNTNRIVREGITNRGFNIRWFLAAAPYNHQRGTAIDVSLGKIVQKDFKATGNYLYTQITKYTEYIMQSDMHELSTLSAIFDSTVHARSETAWIGVPLWPIVTAWTIQLLEYCSNAGLTPLASEWWHFNDLENTRLATDWEITGEYMIEKSYSIPPP
jgi:D-alanyl-D-alanine dipeptidase